MYDLGECFNRRKLKCDSNNQIFDQFFPEFLLFFFFAIEETPAMSITFIVGTNEVEGKGCNYF
jgi:hypothetical protein